MRALLHRLEKRRILRRLHRDLRVEPRVVRQHREPRHQLEALRPRRFQLAQAPRVLPASRLCQILEGNRVEVVVSQRDEAESPAAQLHDLLDDDVHAALPRALAVGAPDRAERAVLRTSAHGLDGGPHVPTGRHEVPPCALERRPLDVPALVQRLQGAPRAVVQHRAPDAVAVASHDGVRAAQLPGFIGVEGRVHAAEDDAGAALAGQPAHRVAAQHVQRVNADADDVARLELIEVEPLERLVREHWIAPFRRRGASQHVQPARRDDGSPERHVAGVDEMHTHMRLRIAAESPVRGRARRTARRSRTG